MKKKTFGFRIAGMFALSAFCSLAAFLPADAENYYFTDQDTDNIFSDFGAKQIWTNYVGNPITISKTTTENKTYQNDSFFVGPGQRMSTSPSLSDTYTRYFYCSSLRFDGALQKESLLVLTSSLLQNCPIILGQYGGIFLNGGGKLDFCSIGATCSITIDKATTYSAPALIQAPTLVKNAEDSGRLYCAISGSGAMRFCHIYDDNGATSYKSAGLYGDNSGYTGVIKVEGLSSASEKTFKLYLHNANALGGDPDGFEEKGLELCFADLFVKVSCAATANRGVYISENSSISVDSGKTFTIAGCVAFDGTGGVKTLAKTGAGALVFAGGCSGAGALDISGSGGVSFQSDFLLDGSIAAGGTAELSGAPGTELLAGGSLTLGGGTKLKVAGSGVLRIGAGSITAAEGAVLAFHWTDPAVPPQLAYSAGAMDAGSSGTIKVAITAEAGVRPSEGASCVLTAGGGFAGKTVIVESDLDWAKTCRIDAAGNIEIAKAESRRGLVFIVR